LSLKRLKFSFRTFPRRRAAPFSETKRPGMPMHGTKLINTSAHVLSFVCMVARMLDFNIYSVVKLNSELYIPIKYDLKDIIEQTLLAITLCSFSNNILKQGFHFEGNIIFLFKNTRPDI
jgi:hypothetical protein